MIGQSIHLGEISVVGHIDETSPLHVGYGQGTQMVKISSHPTHHMVW